MLPLATRNYTIHLGQPQVLNKSIKKLPTAHSQQLKLIEFTFKTYGNETK